MMAFNKPFMDVTKVTNNLIKEQLSLSMDFLLSIKMESRSGLSKGNSQKRPFFPWILKFATMIKNLLFFTVLLFGTIHFAFGQVQDVVNYRTIDGSQNNLADPLLGAAHSPLVQRTTVGFADGYSAVGGVSRPNPREVSNSLFNQNTPLNDPLALSDFIWVIGQFIDHDIGLTGDGPEPLFIDVPSGDPWFDPLGAGMAVIPMHRNTFDPTSGTDTSNPRRYLNEITAFIDASGVYGSDLDRANWLRTFSEGKLKTSEGNLLPYNTVTGEFDDPIDASAPHMDNATGISTVIFVAGDARASENPLLATMHTLFVREHNRQCELLVQKYPDWTDEQLYQHARKIVGGLIQSIVYDEWLPAIGLQLTPYSGYDETINPQLFNVFTAAAFRMGHTLLSSNLMRLDNEGNVIPQGNMTLQDAFFNPYAIQETGGIEPFLKGMGVQIQQEFDAKVISDVRNFLFGQPGFGGLDLASININRGRERGLPDFNTVRENFGLAPYNFFQQINSSAAVFTRLLTLYTDINDIDPWVGMLAERTVPGSIFGQTLHEILSEQFTALRDGDRFYYWNDPVLTDTEKNYIHNTTLRDVIMYNTDINLMQDNVFGALPHQEICDNMTLDLSGQVRTANGIPVSGVNLELTFGTELMMQSTSEDGAYGFAEMPFCDLSLLLPVLNEDHLNGVSTFDIIQIQKHILGIVPFTSPYQQIAADVNASGTITTIDLIRLRKVILGIDADFGNNTSWRFVLGAYEFPEGENPLAQDFPEWLDFYSEHASDYNSGFIAIKVGDVNNSVDPLLEGSGEPRSLQKDLELVFDNQQLKAGELITINLRLQSKEALQGWQFGLQLKDAEIIDVSGDWPSEYLTANNNEFRMSWNTVEASQANGQLKLTILPNVDSELADIILFSRVLAAEAYDASGQVYGLSLKMNEKQQENIFGQNEPNPFQAQTQIPFTLSNGDMVSFKLFSVDGRVVYTNSQYLSAGNHAWVIEEGIIGDEIGVFFYQIVTSTETVTKAMVKQ